MYKNTISLELLFFKYSKFKSVREGEASSSENSVYFYRFDHVGRSFSFSDMCTEPASRLPLNLAKRALGMGETKGLGVSHADDLFYLFR